jgi:hypothetical protein
MALNRALLRAATPIPAGAIYQDTWLSLAAVALGHLVAIKEPTIKYVRHADNVSAYAYTASLASAARRVALAPASVRARIDDLLARAARQAAAFLDMHGGALDAQDEAALRDVAGLPRMGAARMRATAVRHGLWFNSALKNIAAFLLARAREP